MTLYRYLAATAVTALAAAPLAANDAAVRAPAPAAQQSELGGEVSWLLPVAIIAALIAAIIIIADDDESISV